MGAIEYPYGTLENGVLYEKRINDKNYEINETREIIEKAEGTISFISVAVSINQMAVDEDYTEQVRNLITRGLGVLPANVSVERMPFGYQDTSFEDAMKSMEEQEALARRQELTRTIIMWSVIFLLGLMLMFLILTILRAARPAPEPALQPVLVGAGIDYIADEDEDIDLLEEQGVEEVELSKKPTGLEQIGRFIDKDPAAVAQLLRNWLSDE